MSFLTEGIMTFTSNWYAPKNVFLTKSKYVARGKYYRILYL